MNRKALLFFSIAFSLIGCEGKKAQVQNTDSVAVVTENAAKEIENKISVVAKTDSTIPSELSEAALSEFRYTGALKEAWQWYDLNGRNVLILSTVDTKVESPAEDGENTRELYAKHFVIREAGNKPEVLWVLYDVQKDCIFDLTAEFLFSPVITDLDNDQIKESFVAYKLACRSDVSPAKMKIIMHENKNKYALRGTMYVKMDRQAPDTLDTEKWEPDLSVPSVKEGDFPASWGRYENSKEFAEAPASFLEKARSIWRENFFEF